MTSVHLAEPATPLALEKDAVIINNTCFGKREKRKDRLHQNYLRRKASSKVAEDYEKTKAKKKAVMDAKKNALRAEDIAKSVLVPVSTRIF